MRFAIKCTARANGLKPSSTSRHSLNSHSKCNTPYGRPYIASGVLKS
jgi:hypothetical protein